MQTAPQPRFPFHWINVNENPLASTYTHALVHKTSGEIVGAARTFERSSSVEACVPGFPASVALVPSFEAATLHVMRTLDEPGCWPCPSCGEWCVWGDAFAPPKRCCDSCRQG